jgi:hypothetical protein
VGEEEELEEEEEAGVKEKEIGDGTFGPAAGEVSVCVIVNS